MTLEKNRLATMNDLIARGIEDLVVDTGSRGAQVSDGNDCA